MFIKNSMIAAALLVGFDASASSYLLVYPAPSLAGHEIKVELRQATIPNGVVGRSYDLNLAHFLSVAGDKNFSNAAVNWQIAEGALPDGLRLSEAGVISGVPTAEAVSSFKVKATYKRVSDAQSYELLVSAINISVASLPTISGLTYGQVMPDNDLKPYHSVTGDTGYANEADWSVASGVLPNGLTLSADGVLSGTPTNNGSGPVSVQVSHLGQKAFASLSWTPLTQAIMASGSSRHWSDGSFAQSCNEYRNPPAGFSYTGATGDGVYRVKPGATAVDVFCEMSTDGGGWTLVTMVGYYGMRPEVHGKGTAKVCTTADGSCDTAGTSTTYRGTPTGNGIKDYMFTYGPAGQKPTTVIVGKDAPRYLMGTVKAPGEMLYNLMTDTTPGWHHPGNTEEIPSTQGHKPERMFPFSNGGRWSVGNWRGCGITLTCPGATFQMGSDVRGTETTWGNHHYLEHPKFNASTNTYTLAPYTLYPLGANEGREVSKAVLEAARWGVFVR